MLLKMNTPRIEISAPAFDTDTNQLCYPIAPKNRGYFPNLYCLDEDPKTDVARRYICHKCNQSVHPTRGKKLRWHFKHDLLINCSYNKYNGKFATNETIIHKSAKENLCLFLNRGGRLEAERLCEGCKAKGNIIIELGPNDEAINEYRLQDGGSADIVVIDKIKLHNGNPLIKYIIEICHTHTTKSRDGEWFELSASVVNRSITRIGKGTHIIIRDLRTYLCNECHSGISKPNVQSPLLLIQPSVCEKSLLKIETELPERFLEQPIIKQDPLEKIETELPERFLQQPIIKRDPLEKIDSTKISYHNAPWHNNNISPEERLKQFISYMNTLKTP